MGDIFGDFSVSDKDGSFAPSRIYSTLSSDPHVQIETLICAKQNGSLEW